MSCPCIRRVGIRNSVSHKLISGKDSRLVVQPKTSASRPIKLEVPRGHRPVAVTSLETGNGKVSLSGFKLEESKLSVYVFNNDANGQWIEITASVLIAPSQTWKQP